MPLIGGWSRKGTAELLTGQFVAKDDVLLAESIVGRLTETVYERHQTGEHNEQNKR